MSDDRATQPTVEVLTESRPWRGSWTFPGSGGSWVDAAPMSGHCRAA